MIALPHGNLYHPTSYNPFTPPDPSQHSQFQRSTAFGQVNGEGCVFMTLRIGGWLDPLVRSILLDPPTITRLYRRTKSRSHVVCRDRLVIYKDLGADVAIACV